MVVDVRMGVDDLWQGSLVDIPSGEAAFAEVGLAAVVVVVQVQVQAFCDLVVFVVSG